MEIVTEKGGIKGPSSNFSWKGFFVCASRFSQRLNSEKNYFENAILIIEIEFKLFTQNSIQ